MKNFRIIDVLLRVGIAFSLLYPAIDGFFHPDSWLWFFPSWLINPLTSTGIADTTILALFGITEIVIALGILFMKNPSIPALGAAILLFLIVALDYTAFNVVFRDISILLMAVALIVLHGNKNTGTMHTDIDN